MRRKPRPWSKKEIELIKQVHSYGHSHSWPGWEKLLPGRSKDSIGYQYRRCGLIKNGRKRWEESDNKTIIATLDLLAQELGTHRKHLMGHINTLYHQSR